MLPPVSAAEHDLFAVSAPGLERVVAGELKTLGFSNVRELPGGAAFRGSLADALRANLWLRTASRVLLRLAAFDAPGRRELLARLKRLDLSAFVGPREPIAVSATSHQSRLYHTGLVTEAILEAFARLPAARGAAAPQLFVRLVRDRCTLSIDTSGELLHRRGYRLGAARAPLRETLAAGLLLLCDYDGSRPLADPMCGSGTIPIEAALIATGRAPNAARAMAVDRFPGAEPAALAKVRAEALASACPAGAVILGADVNGGALATARANAERAQVASVIRFERANVADLRPPAPAGLLLTNPPYGRRLSRLARGTDAWAALRSALTGAFASWRRAVLGPGVELRERLKLSVVRAVRLENGGLPVELLEYRPPTAEPEAAPAADR